jgi:hypothetical protein
LRRRRQVQQDGGVDMLRSMADSREEVVGSYEIM